MLTEGWAAVNDALFDALRPGVRVRVLLVDGPALGTVERRVVRKIKKTPFGADVRLDDDVPKYGGRTGQFRLHELEIAE